MSYYRERDRVDRGFYRERPERRVSIMVRNLPKSIRWVQVFMSVSYDVYQAADVAYSYAFIFLDHLPTRLCGLICATTLHIAAVACAAAPLPSLVTDIWHVCLFHLSLCSPDDLKYYAGRPAAAHALHSSFKTVCG